MSKYVKRENFVSRELIKRFAASCVVLSKICAVIQ